MGGGVRGGGGRWGVRSGGGVINEGCVGGLCQWVFGLVDKLECSHL